MGYDDVILLIKKFEEEIEAVKKEIFRICWYMRGSLSITEAWNSTHNDRKIMYEIADENLKTTKETGLPYF